jgi:phytoene synthase
VTPEGIMAYHARSFAPAARFLPPKDRLLIARLYVLCRTIDDIADEIGGPVGYRQLLKLHEDLWRSDPKSRLAIEASDLFKGRPLGLSALENLVLTASTDTDATLIDNSADLDTYCMGVAGTVGVMVCTMFDIDEAYHAKAADLGKAMQLTNICRDVEEDAKNGRRYLPFTLCPHSPEDIAAGVPAAVAAAEAAMAILLDQSDDLYVSGRSALAALPLRLRLAVTSAAAMYEGIGSELRRRNFQPLLGRAIVPKDRKIILATRAVIGELVQKRKWKNGFSDVSS